MPRTRTTKKLAQRIDLNYFLRPAPLRQWRFWLSIAALAIAALWLGWHALAGDARVYSSGNLAPAHAVLTEHCEACHVRTTSGFAAAANDAACLACHDGPAHHVSATFTPSCASCHVEHRGVMRLAATADASCTQCHADLHTRAGAPQFVQTVTSFASGHPEFAVLRDQRGDPTTIKLNHYRHMLPNLTGPNGPVQLACQDCHRAPADTRGWRYGAPQFRAVAAPISGDPISPAASRTYLAAPVYAKACAGCHTLQFDKRFSEEVPHDKPEVVHAFLVQKFQAYIGTHAAELRELRQPDRDLPEKTLGPDYRTVTPAEWVAERVSESEQLLWRKTCVQCHALDFAAAPVAPEPISAPAAAPVALPAVRLSNMTTRFMPHARFDHSAHEFLDCTACHVRATSSEESSELLLPGIATCQTCHRPGAQAAESRCFECHTYHDQTARQPAPGRFKHTDLAATAVAPTLSDAYLAARK